MFATILSITGALFIVFIAWAAASGRLYRWFRRFVHNDTRVIVEPPAKRGAVRCGKCQCKFTYTAQDVQVYYRESHISCPACRQTIRIWAADGTEAFGSDADD